MGLKDDLSAEVATIFRSVWTERDGDKVPDSPDIKLANDAVNLKAAVLYADLADSTALVDRYKRSFAAEIYKTFLHCAAKLITNQGGVVTAYDGDRIMGVYNSGDWKETYAVRTALNINYAVTEIINPAIKRQYPSDDYKVRHVVGIDTSDLFVARTGVRGANDLVWVGRAANYAAKLAAEPEDFATYITADVYNNLDVSVRYDEKTKLSMWDTFMWKEFDGSSIYRSNWWWSF